MTPGGIYLLQGDESLIRLNEQQYETESLLQRLLEKYPALLAGEQMNSSEPRRWLLIEREAGVPGEEDGGNRWSLDHLFVDQDGVPTLIEVKRSTDTRIRREVVGQMLDYAANAVVYWPVEAIVAKFENRCERENTSSADVLAEFLGLEADADAFWQNVKTNLQAGRIRMVFVADVIPRELQRVVEFLNEQMDPAEVLALEVKQFVGEGVKSLVPRVIGQTAEAERKKRPASGVQWDAPRFFEALSSRCSPEAVEVARRLLKWIEDKPELSTYWGKGKSDGSFTAYRMKNGELYSFFAVYTIGFFYPNFEYLVPREEWRDESAREELRRRLNEIPGVALPPGSINRRPRIPLDTFAKPESYAKLIEALEWAVARSL